MATAMNADLFAPPRESLGTEPKVDPPPLWNPDAAGIWSLFITPVFGSALVLKNWQSIGDDSQARTARVWLIASIIATVCYMFVPLLGCCYIVIWYFACQRKQTKYIKERWGKDYPRKSWSVPLLLGIGGFMVFAMVFGWLTTLSATA
jgi:hypothetical protein